MENLTVSVVLIKMSFEIQYEESLSMLREAAKKSSTEDLYKAVRIYLENRKKNNGKDVPNLEREVSMNEEFLIYEDEILGREREANKKILYSQRTRSEYLVGFGDLLVEAGIIKFHPYGITDRKLIN